MNYLKTEKGFRRKVIKYLNSEEEMPKTFIGLAVYLGKTKAELEEIRAGKHDTSDYKFSSVIKEADTLFEKYAESLLFTKTGSHSGIMFYLKSVYGWQDKEKEEKEDIRVNISVI